MAKGGSSSNTTTQTTNQYTDRSANAAEGATAIGAGANVNIQSLDKDVAAASVNAQRDTAGIALAANQNVSGMAIAANQNVSAHAIDTTAAVAADAVNTVAGLAEVSARERQDVLNTTTTALQSQQGNLDQLAQLAGAALERSQTPDSQTTKTLLYVVGAAVVAVALILTVALRRK